MSIRVLLADDHAVVRQALRLLLESAGYQVVGEATDGLQAVRLARELQPDVAVLDWMMPQLNGLDAAREMRQAAPRTRTILLTARTDEHRVVAALKEGVAGCVLKSEDAKELVTAIREVARGGRHLDPGLSRAAVDVFASGSATAAERLTLRERQVLQLIAEGKRTREVAELLSVSVRTVESHRANIMKKLDVRETASLVRYAIRHGLCEL